MLAEIPRKPVFPEHMIVKMTKQIERDVEEDVIPVSAGIYSQYKLVEKLQAIPKPIIVNYEDPIFYDLAGISKYPCKLSKCPLCDEEFGLKKNFPVQCHFCGVWNCNQCICLRKRYHPRAKESNSDRFQICHNCDDKFLSLQLHHNYVQSKALLQQVMRRVRAEKDEIELQCQKRESDSSKVQQMMSKNKFKMSAAKKEQVDFRKHIIRMQTEKEQERIKLSVRQKYLKLLLRKKEKLQSTVDIIKPTSESTNSKEDSPPQKGRSIRQLTTTNVLSEVVNADIAELRQSQLSQAQSFKQKQQQPMPFSKQKQVTTKDENSFNFYNYSEWRSEQDNNQAEQKINYSQNKQNAEFEAEGEASGNVGTQELVQYQKYDEAKKGISNENFAIDTGLYSNQIQETESNQQRKQNNHKRDYLAEIFIKKQKLIQMQEDEVSQHESLKQEVIQVRKAEVVRSAIQQFRRERMMMEMPVQDRKTCSCTIY